MKKIKILFYSIVDVIMLMLVSTIFSVLVGFASALSTNSIFFILFPVILVGKFYFNNLKIKPLEKEVEYLRKENDQKDQVIKKFLEFQGVDS